MAGITLAQLAQVEKDPLAKFMELSILRECKVMDKLPFDTVSSLKVAASWWEQLPTAGAWRSINEGYTSSEDGQLGEGQEALFGFGTDITFDNIMEKVKNVAKDPVRLQIEGKLKSISMTWNDVFINGDPAVDPKQFTGLKKRVAGLPARQTMYFTAATSDAALDPTASAANVRRFFDILEMGQRYCNSGNVSAILCTEDFIVGLGRALRYAQTQGNFLDVSKDTFGRDFVTYRGIPLVDMGYKKDLTTEILPLEADGAGTAANSMSVYFVSFNQNDGVYGIQLEPLKVYDPLNGGEMESKPSKLRRIDWWNGIANFGKYSIVRARNLEKLAGWT